MIVQKENPVLRQITREVPIKDIQSAKIKKIIAQMKKESDGLRLQLEAAKNEKIQNLKIVQQNDPSKAA